MSPSLLEPRVRRRRGRVYSRTGAPPPRGGGCRTHAHDSDPAARSLAEAPWSGNGATGLGIVIPALDEAATIAAAVRRVLALPGPPELVVVDGGSTDDTVARARAAGARVVVAPRGRGSQMNAGAHATGAPALLFLHADCELPPGAVDAVGAVLAAGSGAGIFRIRYASRHPLLRLVGALSRFESRCTSFGEGALFVRREVFTAVGGFPEWPLFEDADLLRRLRRATRIGRARGTVVASPRRYAARGVWRQQLRNTVLFGLWNLGVSPERLQRHYGFGPRPVTGGMDERALKP